MARPLHLGALLAGWLPAAWAAATINWNRRTDRVQVDPATGLFRDGFGRVRIFHGVNVVFKEEPWYPVTDRFDHADSLDASTMETMRLLGFNIVRLGVMWPGVEPEKGKISSAYLDKMASIAKDLASWGMYTIADLHQDIGSRRYCGEGYPEYYVDELAANPNSSLARAVDFPKPMWHKFSNTSVPSLQECVQHNFGDYYATAKVGAMVNELYTNGTDFNRGFVRYWQAVASRFRDTPHVLAYELLNEPPFACTHAADVLCFDAVKVVGNFVEDEQLTPLYQEAAKVIRAVDTETPIMYEPVVGLKVMGTFREPPLGNDPQQILGYHIYCTLGVSTLPVPVCDVTHRAFMSQYMRFLRKFRGIGGFMTEFGAIKDVPVLEKEVTMLLDLADKHLQSWCYWALKYYRDFTTIESDEGLFDANGDLLENKTRTVTRTYAQAIAGHPHKMSFDASTGDFVLVFDPSVSDAPTEVYLNEDVFYPNGWYAQVIPPNCLWMEQEEVNYLQFFLSDDIRCKVTLTLIISRNQWGWSWVWGTWQHQWRHFRASFRWPWQKKAEHGSRARGPKAPCLWEVILIRFFALVLVVGCSLAAWWKWCRPGAGKEQDKESFSLLPDPNGPLPLLTASVAVVSDTQLTGRPGAAQE